MKVLARRARARRGPRPTLRLMLGAGLAAAASFGPALAQAPAAHDVEIGMGTVNGEVRCTPTRVRVPASQTVDLLVTNGSERQLWFVAPEFFARGRRVESAGFAVDLTKGGFLVAPQSKVGVRLLSPGPGEYYYSCYEPGARPEPESSGFLLVAPAAL